MFRLLRTAYAHGVVTLDQANELYSRLVWLLFGAIGLVALGVAANLAGIGQICLVLLPFFAVATTIIWIEPARVVLVAITGAIAGGLGSGSSGGAKKWAVRFVEIYVDLLGKILLWGTIILLILGLVPFGGHPEALAILITGTALLGLMSWQWKIRPSRMFMSAAIVAWLGSLVYVGDLMIPLDWYANSPSFNVLGAWSWHRWLIMLMFGGALTFAIWYFWGEGARKKAVPIIVGVLLLFLGVPIVIHAPLSQWIGNHVLGLSQSGPDATTEEQPPTSAAAYVPTTLKLPVIAAGADRSQYLPVQIPPGGRTAHIVPEDGQYVHAKGTNVSMETTFADKTVCTSNDPGCTKDRHGAVLYVEIINRDKENSNTVYLALQ